MAQREEHLGVIGIATDAAKKKTSRTAAQRVGTGLGVLMEMTRRREERKMRGALLDWGRNAKSALHLDTAHRRVVVAGCQGAVKGPALSKSTPEHNHAAAGDDGADSVARTLDEYRALMAKHVRAVEAEQRAAQEMREREAKQSHKQQPLMIEKFLPPNRSTAHKQEKLPVDRSCSGRRSSPLKPFVTFRDHGPVVKPRPTTVQIKEQRAAAAETAMREKKVLQAEVDRIAVWGSDPSRAPRPRWVPRDAVLGDLLLFGDGVEDCGQDVAPEAGSATELRDVNDVGCAEFSHVDRNPRVTPRTLLRNQRSKTEPLPASAAAEAPASAAGATDTASAIDVKEPADVTWADWRPTLEPMHVASSALTEPPATRIDGSPLRHGATRGPTTHKFDFEGTTERLRFARMEFEHLNVVRGMAGGAAAHTVAADDKSATGNAKAVGGHLGLRILRAMACDSTAANRSRSPDGHGPVYGDAKDSRERWDNPRGCVPDFARSGLKHSDRTMFARPGSAGGVTRTRGLEEPEAADGHQNRPRHNLSIAHRAQELQWRQRVWDRLWSGPQRRERPVSAPLTRQSQIL